MSDPKENTPDAQDNIDIKYRVKAAAFLTIIGGVGLLAGFGGAVATAKKQDPSYFDQGLAKTKSSIQVRFYAKISETLEMLTFPSETIFLRIYHISANSHLRYITIKTINKYTVEVITSNRIN